MAANYNASPREGLTFDDVLIKPGLSEVLPADVDIRSHITRSIPVNIPIIASAMDTVTEDKWRLPWRRREASACFTATWSRMSRPRRSAR